MLYLKRKENNNNSKNLEFVESCLIVEIYEAKRKDNEYRIGIEKHFDCSKMGWEGGVLCHVSRVNQRLGRVS